MLSSVCDTADVRHHTPGKVGWTGRARREFCFCQRLFSWGTETAFLFLGTDCLLQGCGSDPTAEIGTVFTARMAVRIEVFLSLGNGVC